MSSGIAGKSVLVTRPEGQAESLLQQLNERGAQAIPFPVVDIRPIPVTPRDRQKIIDLDRYDILVVVSSNAAKLGIDLIDQYWPQLPAHLNWYAVGEATARMLLRCGVDAAVPDTGANSEALLAYPALQSVAGQRVLLLKGEGGRELLQETLSDRGAEVENLVLYRRERLEYARQEVLQRIGGALPDYILATSVAILENTHGLLSPCYPNLISVNLVAASERIAQRAKSLGYQHVVVAEGASDQAVLESIDRP